MTVLDVLMVVAWLTQFAEVPLLKPVPLMRSPDDHMTPLSRLKRDRAMALSLTRALESLDRNIKQSEDEARQLRMAKKDDEARIYEQSAESLKQLRESTKLMLALVTGKGTAAEWKELAEQLIESLGKNRPSTKPRITPLERQRFPGKL